ncbi:hypothetical protein GC176_21405 [bacterium]|nr:hypothetical protein [bacterium]
MQRLCPYLPAFLALLMLSAGCGTKSPRQAVFGTISGVDSRSGTVTFQPAEGVHAPAARATLDHGAFRFDESDGPLPGTYRVRIDVQKPRILKDGVVIAKEVEVPASASGELPPEMESFYVEDIEVGVSGRQELNLTIETRN